MLDREKFIWFNRTPPDGLRYIRAMFAPPNTRPSPLALAHKSVLGWTLDAQGRCIRLLYLNCQPGPDGNPDGCGDYYSDDLKDAEAGVWNGVGKPLGPMRPLNSSPGLMAEERMARREHAEHWILYFERQAAEEARKRAAEAEAHAKAQAEKAQIPPPPPPPPKRSLLERLIGR